jgi:two-component system, OmpR family, sensor histidine kinase QseC
MTMSENTRPNSMDSKTTASKSLALKNPALKNTTSIRRVLLVSIIGVTTLVLLVASVFSYRAGLQEAGELFDAKLAHSSRVLMSLVDEPLADLALRSDGAPSADDAMVIKVWHGNREGVGEALAMPGGHAYETKLAFQVRDARGTVLLRSDSGPSRPLAPLKSGFANLVIDGEHWRTFTLKSATGRWYQSGELSAIREEIAEEIAVGTLMPLLAAVPLVALFVWLAVNWASRSLLRVSDAVEQRAPERLTPIELERAPREVQGILNAVNGLLDRLDKALARERRFTADAAHELRTPIAALKVHAYNLRQSANDDEREHSQRHLDAGILRMERLVAQLLALSRIESGAVPAAHRHVDLVALAQRHERDYAALGSGDGKRIVLTAEPATVLGDELTIDALLRNLLDNAMRYTPPGGEIAISVGRDGDRAQLVIEDSGPGIPEEARQRVFNRFHRELGTGVEGSGLGLSIVAQALHQHRGEIVLDASPTLGGLRATVTLPAL